MQRLVLVGDTHLPRFGRVLPQPLVESLRDADRILHVGDITEAWVLDLLGEHAPVEAVAGNNDGPELRRRLGLTRVVEVEGLRIGLTHGHHGPGRTTPERARRAFGDVDAVAFGHSHQPMIARDGERWLLNAGSPTDRRREPAFSFLRLEVSGRALRAELVTYDEWRENRARRRSSPGQPIAPRPGVTHHDGELPGPRDEEDAARMERQAREAEQHITELHEASDPDENPIYEE